MFGSLSDPALLLSILGIFTIIYSTNPAVASNGISTYYIDSALGSDKPSIFHL